MKQAHLKVIFAVLLLGLAMGWIAIGAAAQGLTPVWGCSGNFTLPFEAYWGAVSLPAGNYTFVIDHPGGNGRLFLRQGVNNVGIVLAQQFSSAGVTKIDHAALVYVQRSGRCDIRALKLPNVGTFYYSVPASSSTHTAENPEINREIAVIASGK
jgi:hypothetical protein